MPQRVPIKPTTQRLRSDPIVGRPNSNFLRTKIAPKCGAADVVVSVDEFGSISPAPAERLTCTDFVRCVVAAVACVDALVLDPSDPSDGTEASRSTCAPAIAASAAAAIVRNCAPEVAEQPSAHVPGRLPAPALAQLRRGDDLVRFAAQSGAQVTSSVRWMRMDADEDDAHASC